MPKPLGLATPSIIGQASLLVLRRDTLVVVATQLSAAAQRMAQRLPGAVFGATADALRDEVHTVHTVGNIGIKASRAIEGPVAGPGNHVGVGGCVNVRKGFEVALRMTAGNSAGAG